MLIVCSGLMFRTFSALRDVDPGVSRPEAVQIARINITAGVSTDPERYTQIQREILERLAAIPGVEAASFGFGASVLVFLYNMITSWKNGPIAPPNPWRALTLEWQVSSPPPIFNFSEIPQVVGSPYEYGVPGAQHAILTPSRTRETEEVGVT